MGNLLPIAVMKPFKLVGSMFYTQPKFTIIKAEQAAQVAAQLSEHRIKFDPVLAELTHVHVDLKVHFLNVLKKYSGTKGGNVVDIAHNSVNLPDHIPRSSVNPFFEEVSRRGSALASQYREASLEQVAELSHLRDNNPMALTRPARQILKMLRENNMITFDSCKDKILELSTIISKDLDNSNISDLIDIGCFYEINPTLTGVVMEHYIITMVGSTLFVSSYVAIHLYQQELFRHVTNSQVTKYCIQRSLEERVFSYPKFFVAGGTFLSFLLFSRSGLFITAPEPSTMFNLGAVLSRATVDFSKGWASNFNGVGAAWKDGLNVVSKTIKFLWKR